MLNKKSLYHLVYAISLVGAILSAVGIFNEFLNVLQLKGVSITNTVYMEHGTFRDQFLFYFLAFLISTAAITFLILHLIGKVKVAPKTVNTVLITACALLFVLSFVFIYVLRVHVEGAEYRLSYFGYLQSYTLRSGVLSFVANIGILLGCSALDKKNDEQGGEH